MKHATAVALLFALALTFIAPPLIFAASEQSPLTKAEQKKRDAELEKLGKTARKAFRKGYYPDAVKAYQAILHLDPTNIAARLGASYAYYKGLDYKSCFDLATEVLKLDSTNARAHALIGASLLRSGFIVAAIPELNQAFKLNPKEALAYGAAAEIDYYEGRCDQSIAKAFRAISLDSSEEDFLITIARASSRIELYDQAAEAYERFLTVAPETDKERRDRISGLIEFYRKLAGLRVHEVSGSKTSQVPFELGNDRRPYINVKMNGRDAIFVVDTGSGFTVISKEAAKKFKVPEIAHGGHSQGVGGSGKFPIVYGLVNTLQLGEVKVRSVPCFIRPFHSLNNSAADVQADGFIGLSVLSRFLTELDYQSNVMRLSQDIDQSVVATSPDMTVVPFRTTQNGLISIETELDGKNTINAILDSGASSTVISTHAVDRLNLREQIIKGQKVRVIGAGGISDNVELLFIKNCRVADLRQDNLRALVLDFSAINETSGFEQSGILGGDFLRHFSVTINFAKAQVGLKPHTTSIKKIPAETKNQALN
ncbi:MAG: aspartyl protease family protein [Acidobacteriota bacterium]